MPDFQKVDHPLESPTECYLCGNIDGPFIDTAMLRQEGRVAICASNEQRIGCVRQLGRLDGLYEPTSVEEIDTKLREALARLEPVAQQVLEEKLSRSLEVLDQFEQTVTALVKNKLVPAVDVYELGKRHAESE